MLSPRIVLKLLEEAKGIPVMFSILLPSGNVVLEVQCASASVYTSMYNS